MTSRFVVGLALLAVGCRKDPPTAPPNTGGTGSESAKPPVAVANPVVEPAGAPPGDATLRPVPADVARGVKLELVARSFDRPVLVTTAPGDARKRLFVVEQHKGRVRIIENGKTLPTPMLRVNVSKANEQGLLGLAFHPQFATNGLLYIDYTTQDKATHIVEYKVSATNPDQADVVRELIRIEDPYTNHNGGHLAFGPDGMLWAGQGDGGSAGDPQGNGQNPTALLAKMLRIDVSAAQPTAEIMHLGVRNPWRWDFDPKTGDLYIGDVGQNLWEYVFVIPKDSPKRNFGWNVVEGSHCYDAEECKKDGFTPPAVEYEHGASCSITGGIVYRGKALPALDGVYFYADFCSAIVRSFKWTPDLSSPTSPGFTREHWDWRAALDPEQQLSQISSFGRDQDGELYIVSLEGSIWKLVPKS